MSELGIDPAAVRGVAAVLRTSSEIVAECGRAVHDTEFGASTAGRDYADCGLAVQAGLARMSQVLEASARNGAARADALAATVERYVDQDRTASRALDRTL